MPMTRLARRPIAIAAFTYFGSLGIGLLIRAVMFPDVSAGAIVAGSIAVAVTFFHRARR